MIWPFVVAPLALLAAWRFDRRRRLYADQGTTPAAAVSAGRNEVKGRAWHRNPVKSHLTETSCVWWDYRLEEERNHTRTVTETDSKGNTRTKTEHYTQWHEIDSRRGAARFVEVVDDSGAAEVRFEGAAVSPRVFASESFKEHDDRGFLQKLVSFDSRTGEYRHTERGIAIGDQLFVSGEASMPSSASSPRIDHGKPFVISTRSEESHRGRAAIAIPILVLIALGLTVLGAASFDNPAVLAAAIAAFVLILVSAATVIVFNQLRGLAEQAARAWSLIDVQLTRRHDLVPQLQRIAKAALAHERITLEAVTAARSFDSGNDPDDATVAEAGEEARRQTEQLRTLFAVIEDHPELRADTSIAHLRDQLSDTENRIAGARSFYNETVTLLRDRARTFPGILIARAARPRRFALFQADGFERTVPAVTYDFDEEPAA